MEESTMYGIRVSEGIVALLFGIAAVFWPGETIITLLYLFASFVLLTGVFNLTSGIFHAGQGMGSWFLKVIVAVVQIGVGVFLLRHPHVTFATFILLIGFTLIVRGVFEVVVAFMDAADAAGNRAMLTIVGVIGVLAGIVVLFQPISSGVAFVWVLGLYALIAGPVVIAVAISEHHDSHKTIHVR